MTNALTRQSLQAQIISDPAQAAALRELLGEGAIEAGNVAIVMLDGDGIDGNRATITFDNAPGAASVPTSDRDQRGLVASPRDQTITTTDGYTFSFGENEVRIDWPGREGGEAETVFNGNLVIEGDGTEWEAVDGNYILPNGAMFTLDFEEDGRLKNFTLVHGDSRVDVGNLGDDPRVGRVRDGGYAYRMDAVEQNFEGATFRMGGYNDMAGEGDVAWNVEHLGQHLGVMTEDGVDPFANFVVDESLRPEFGTQDYERALRAEIEDLRSMISGGVQSSGGTDAYGDLVADYLLGNSGTYDQYANALQQSVDAREAPSGGDAQMREIQRYLEQMFGGMPQTQSWDQGMQALAYLMQMHAQSQGMQSDYASATSNLRGYIPQAPVQQQQQGYDAAMLVAQILNGVGEQQRNGGNRNRLEAFDLANGGYQGPARRGADDSLARLLQRRVQTQGVDRRDTGRVEQTEGEVELNATRTAARIHDAIAGLGTDEDALIRELSGATGAERARLKEVYQELFGESIEDAIAGDTGMSPQFRGSLESLLNSTRREDNRVDDVQATRDAAALHEAIDSDLFDPSSWGTDEDKLRDILTNRSPAEVRRIGEIYEETYGESLRDALDGDLWDTTLDELGSGFRDSLVHQLDRAAEVEYEIEPQTEEDRVRTRATQVAMGVHEAVSGAGTDEAALIRNLTGLSNEERAEVRSVYREMYGSDIVDDIEWDTSFNFESTLRKLLTNRVSDAPVTELQATRDAAALHAAVAGMGTNDGDLQDLLTSRSPAQLRAMSEAYQSMYGESAIDAVEWDTSGYYEQLLVAQLSSGDRD